jgi:hypothetical protein
MENCQLPTWFGCCCVCQHHVNINGHPHNNKTFKTKITQAVGYGCAVECHKSIAKEPGKLPTVIFKDTKHGICEMFAVRDELNDWLETYKRIKGEADREKEN